MKNWFLISVSAIIGSLIVSCSPQQTPSTITNTPTQIIIPSTVTPLPATPTSTSTNSTLVEPIMETPAVEISTPLAGFTIAPLVPMASPNNGPLNCRSGPGVAWPVGTVLNMGQGVEVAGKSTDGGWWYVKNSNVTSGYCWVSAIYATVSGNTSLVPVIVTSEPPPIDYAYAGTIIDINMSVDPNTIQLPGCVGPIQPVKVFAKIKSNGPLKIEMYFEDEFKGNLPLHKITFERADIIDVADSFTPSIEEGKHWVVMQVEDIDLSRLGGIATYTIVC